MTETIRRESHADGSSVKQRDTAGILVAKQVPNIVKVACRFAHARQRKAVVFMLGDGDPGSNRFDYPITRRTAEHLVNALGDSAFDDLDLLVHSSGGEIHAAYLIMSMLQERVKKGGGTLTACVPSRAQSAATLLCLGADEILLGDLGTLGPLDAQIRKGTTDAGTANYISALHLLKALSRLQEFSLESFTAMARHLDTHQASHDDQLTYGIRYSHAITCPLFEHIEAQEVGYWDQMLKTGEEYGRRLLEKGDLVADGCALDRSDHIQSIVHKLVFEYPSHELVIDADALVDLGLRARPIPGNRDYPDKDASRISRQFTECASETLIMVVDPHGPPAPPDSTEEFLLKDWQSIGEHNPRNDPQDTARDIVWAEKDTTFAMRIALFRPAVKGQRWDEAADGLADGGPATQYFGGGGVSE